MNEAVFEMPTAVSNISAFFTQQSSVLFFCLFTGQLVTDYPIVLFKLLFLLHEYTDTGRGRA